MTQKAKVALVDLGYIQVEGLLLPSGEYRMGVTQVARLLPDSVTPNNATREVKRILGEDFQFELLYTELNSRKVNTITLQDFEKVVYYYALKGNGDAVSLMSKIDPKFKLTPSTKIKSKQIEKIIQIQLAEILNGQIEVKTLAGIIDILTLSEIIEVKSVRGWKSALGQILVYGDYYPSHSKRIHLYGETQNSYLDMIVKHCSKRDVNVSWQQNYYSSLKAIDLLLLTDSGLTRSGRLYT